MTTNFRSAFARAKVSGANGAQARGEASLVAAIGGGLAGDDAHPTVARNKTPARRRIGSFESTSERAARFHHALARP